MNARISVIACIALTQIAFAADSEKRNAVANEPGQVQCANLIYATNKTSVCFSPKFLEDLQQQTNVITSHQFSPVRMDSAELFKFPFAVMTGEGAFTLTQIQRDNLHDYLTNGGFLLASAGCSSAPWSTSFRQEIAKIFPDAALVKLELDNKVFHTVYDVQQLNTKHAHDGAKLEGLEVEGKIVLVFSSDGLNDTANAGGNCCCCGGDEIRNARQINVNLLAYALTH